MTHTYPPPTRKDMVHVSWGGWSVKDMYPPPHMTHKYPPPTRVLHLIHSSLFALNKPSVLQKSEPYADTRPLSSSLLPSSLPLLVPGWRIHGGVEDTKLSTNKQLSLSPSSQKASHRLTFFLSLPLPPRRRINYNRIPSCFTFPSPPLPQPTPTNEVTLDRSTSADEGRMGDDDI